MEKKLFGINYIMLFFIYSFSKYVLRLNNIAFFNSVNIILGFVFVITVFLIQIIVLYTMEKELSVKYKVNKN